MLSRNKVIPCPPSASGRRQAGYFVRHKDIPQEYWDAAGNVWASGFVHEEEIKNPAYWPVRTGGGALTALQPASEEWGWLIGDLLEPFLETERNEWGEVAP